MIDITSVLPQKFSEHIQDGRRSSSALTLPALNGSAGEDSKWANVSQQNPVSSPARLLSAGGEGEGDDDVSSPAATPPHTPSMQMLAVGAAPGCSLGITLLGAAPKENRAHGLHRRNSQNSRLRTTLTKMHVASGK